MLSGVAALGLVGWFAGGSDLKAWAPNVTVGALTIAATITVIERALQREGRRRLRPRIDNVHYWIGLGFRGLISGIVTDYAWTHADTFRAIPADAIQMIDLWLSEQEAEDVPRWADKDDGLPSLVGAGREFVLELERWRSRDLDVLEPDLVGVMDDFGWNVGQALQLFGFIKQDLANDTAQTEQVALRTIVEAARRFAEVFRRHSDPGWMRVLDIQQGAAAEISERTRQALGGSSRDDG